MKKFTATKNTTRHNKEKEFQRDTLIRYFFTANLVRSILLLLFGFLCFCGYQLLGSMAMEVVVSQPEVIARILAVTLAVPLLSAGAVQADDWPQFRGPNRDGVWG